MAIAEQEAKLGHIGRRKYKRGGSKKRVVNKQQWRSVLSMYAKNRGLAHENLKTGDIVGPTEVI